MTNPHQLNLQALAAVGGEVVGRMDRVTMGTSLDDTFERLAVESCVSEGLLQVDWHARAEMRQLHDGAPQIWMHLEAAADVSLTCQRCMTPVVTHVVSQRWFRFVDDEAAAEAEDELSDEDVLVLEPKFNLLTLVEDELLMSLPFVPMHEACPVEVVTSVRDQGFSDEPQERQHPFADLRSKLKQSDN